MGLLDVLPVAAMERSEVWEIARRLGFKVPGDQVMSVNLYASGIEVITADLNEAGQKFAVVNPETHEREVSTTIHRFRYADVQREFDEADARRAEREATTEEVWHELEGGDAE
jgi:hypothetical protein